MTHPVALVTGASRGIGKRFCIDLARAGYDVVCTARSSQGSPGRLPGTIEETARLVVEEGRRALPVALDVRDEEAVAKLADRIYAEWGRCDLLVNNAALSPPKPALEDSTKRWRLGIDVNVNGPFYMVYYLAPRMVEAGKVAVNCIRLEVAVWTEGFAATLPEDAPVQFEDAVIMSDALLWFAKQRIDYTGKVLSIAELREMGVVRPFTPAKRGS